MAPRAPVTERRIGDAALVLGAHGIRGGVGGADQHARRIAARGLFAEVHACALKGRPSLNEVVAAVHAPDLVFAPLLRRLSLAARSGTAFGIVLCFAAATRFEPSVLRASGTLMRMSPSTVGTSCCQPHHTMV